MTLFAQRIVDGSSFLTGAVKNYFVYENIKKMGIEATPLSFIPTALAMLFAENKICERISLNEYVDRIFKPNSTLNKAFKWATSIACIGLSTLLFSQLLSRQSGAIFKQIVILTHYTITNIAINNISTNIANCISKPRSGSKYLNKKVTIYKVASDSLSLLAFILANIASRNFLPNIFLVNILNSSAGIITRTTVDRYPSYLIAQRKKNLKAQKPCQ